MEKLLVLIGPTGVGKTEVALKLAERLQGEIISADSMQIYQGMDIGTAKPTMQEQQIVPHHLIDVVSPGEAFSVADFQKQARERITEITSRGLLPMLVGGTGLYVRAVIDHYNFIPADTDWEMRDHLRRQAQEAGLDTLYYWLKEVDPVAAGRLHPNDERRIVRALEVYQTTGQPLSFWEQQGDTGSNRYDLQMFGLTRPREKLYERINLRVEQMAHSGLIEEARRLLARGLDENFIANQAIGYKELFPHLRGEETLAEALEKLKQTTRRYAKRQLTWFRADQRIRWLDVSLYQDATSLVDEILQIIAVRWKIV